MYYWWLDLKGEQDIVELARAGRSLTALAREFEPTVETIRQWVKQAERDE